MNKIVFYEDDNNKDGLESFLINLHSKKDKNSRIQFNKIIAYINMLERYGINLGQPYIKYIGDNIWELRPIRYRILFSYYDNNKFVLLTIFIKKTQKTPKREIEKAQRYLKNFIKGNGENGKK